MFARALRTARGRLRFAGGLFAHGDEHIQRVARTSRGNARGFAFEAFIRSQAAKHAGRAPTFVPHVTLAGGFVGTEAEARDRTSRIAADLAATASPLECRVLDATAGEVYFQCVYLRMVPTDQLNRAHELAATAFGVVPGNGGGRPYMPHLSLVYGDLDASERRAAAEEATRELLGDRAPEAGFLAEDISLWRTDIQDMTCRTWSRVERFPLRFPCSQY